jgi:hypothetical protein
MTRAVVASVDVPRTQAGEGIPTVALLGFHGGLHLARPVDGTLEALIDLLLASGISGGHVLVDMPLSGTQGPVDQALDRAGLPPRFWREEALDKGRTLAEGIQSSVDDVKLYESNPWSVLRVLWALRARRRLPKLADAGEAPLLDERLREVEPPALQNPYVAPSSGTGLKRVAKVIEDSLAMFGLSVALESAASTTDEEETVRVTARCRALLGLLVGSLLRRRSPLVVTLDQVDPPLALLAEPYLRDRLLEPGEG